MIYGIGTDLINAERFTALIARFPLRLPKRLLSANELTAYQAAVRKESFLAKRWAAKEALAKALGLGFRQGLRMNECEVSHSDLGQPLWLFHGQTAELIARLPIQEMHLSISDEPPMALAFVVATRKTSSS